MPPSPRRTRSQKEKTPYVDNDDDDFDKYDFDDNNEVNCMEDLNSFMKNAIISGGMRTVTLHIDQPWRTFGLCHIWPQKIEDMFTSTTDNCVEQRWVVNMIIIKFLVINPNNLPFRNVYFGRVAEGGKTIYFYYPLIPGNIEQDPTMFLKQEVLDDEDDVPIDNSHQEEVMVMKMARKIEGLTGIFG